MFNILVTLILYLEVCARYVPVSMTLYQPRSKVS